MQRKVRAEQAELKLRLGAGYHGDGYLFCQLHGQPYHPERLSREFDRNQRSFNRDADQRMPTITLHGLRHTWAALALSAGIDIKIVSERLTTAAPTSLERSTPTSPGRCRATQLSMLRGCSSCRDRPPGRRSAKFESLEGLAGQAAISSKSWSRCSTVSSASSAVAAISRSGLDGARCCLRTESADWPRRLGPR
jgi:hypothetical protein